MDLRQGIVEAANAIGLPPEDLATIISYESGFRPNVWGGKGGNYYGLIQFGPAERAQYGVTVGDPASQLGPEGAIVKYFRDRGFKPGMGLLDAYSTVNAGSPGRYNASDAAAGGMPGTVADKVNNQFGRHRALAAAFLGSADPGTSSPYNLHVRHPPNPTTGVGGVPPAMAKPPEKKTLMASLGEGLSAMGGGGGGGGYDYRVPSLPGAVLASEPAAPIIDAQAQQLQRQQLAEAMARLNTGRLWG